MDGQELGEASAVILEEASSSLYDVPAAPGRCMAPSPDAESQDVITDTASHGSPTLGRCSEALMLEYAFQACDLEGTGEVSASRILEYLQCVTGQSCEGEGLRSLHRRLDPDESGVSVDLRTFHAVMGEWIAEQRQERAYEGAKNGNSGLENVGLLQSGKVSASGAAQLEGYGGDIQKFSLGEAVDLMSKIEDLEYANKKLVAENGKLQRSFEVLEEAGARLAEEITGLRSKLKASQQALQDARSTTSELEELKMVVKSLEEKNSQLQVQSRQLEKERQCLSSQIQDLQEVNEKLLAERERARRKIDQLVTETIDLQRQLGDYENFLIQKDVLLRQSANQAEELKETLEEYQDIIQELKAEIIQLQKQLSQTSMDILKFPEASLGTALASIQNRMSQSLRLEIEDVQQGRDTDVELIGPMRETLPWLGSTTVPTLRDELLGTWEEISNMSSWEGTAELVTQARQGIEALLHHIKQFTDSGNMPDRKVEVQSLACGLEEAGEALLHRFDCLAHRKATWESHLHPLNIQLKIYQQQEQQWLWQDIKSSAGKEEKNDPGKLELKESSGVEMCGEREGGGGQDTDHEKVAYPVCFSTKRLDPTAERRTEMAQPNLALLPVKNQLIPISGSPSEPACQLWLLLVQVALVLGFVLLLPLLSMLLSGYGDRIWTTMRGVLWPHIQLRYLKPPPV